MSLTRTTFIRIVRYSLIALLVVFIISYAIWRSSSYASGPRIFITEPKNGDSISSLTVTIKGHVLRLNSLKVNGYPISMDTSGNFSETIGIFKGINVFSFEGEDQFHRVTHSEIEVLGLAEASSTN